jgi:hypothetical protein
MEKSILIKSDGKTQSIKIDGFSDFEALGIMRFYEKTIWLHLSRQQDKQMKEATTKSIQDELQKEIDKTKP